MATATLGSQSAGSLVKLRVNGESRNFIVVQQGCPSALYDASCGGTWLLMQDIYCTRPFDAAYNKFAEADLTAWLNEDFVALLSEDIQSRLVTAKIPYMPTPLDEVNSGSNGYPVKAFLLSQREVGLSTGLYSPGDGALLSYFTSGVSTSANSRRTALLDGVASGWWMRSPYTLNYSSEWIVAASGSSDWKNVSAEVGVRPALILPASMCVGDDGLVSGSTPPAAPGSITLPASVTAGTSLTISWTAASSGSTAVSGYLLERSTDGGATYTQIYKGTALSYTDTVDSSWTRVKYRVCSYASDGTPSAYTVSTERTVAANGAPTVSGSVENGSSLGEKSEGFRLQYSVADADSTAVTVREYLDGTLKKTASVTPGSSCTLEVTADEMLRLSNDADHTLTVVANDGGADSTEYTVTFHKAAHTATATLTAPLSSGEAIRSVLLSVEGRFPSDALLSVLVTNNAGDASPVWEDATQAVRSGQRYVFTNGTAANGFAFNFKVAVSRGTSGESGYLTAIRGSYSSGTSAGGGTAAGGSALDLFSLDGTTDNQKLWNAVNTGGLYSGGNQTLTLSYTGCTPPGTGLGALRYYIAYRDDATEMADTGAETVIRDTVFQPEGSAPVLLQFRYKSGALTFENCTFRNVLFWFGETAKHTFTFRNCVIEDNEYNFIHCGEQNANAEYVIEGCTFRHMRPDKAEYRADIVPLKLNGWAHGNLRCLGYDVQWTIRDTLFEDCMGQLNIFFGKSSLVEADPSRVTLHMERCTVRQTNGAGVSFQGQPVTGWIRDCNFYDIGANRCNAEGYDLPTDAAIHSGSGTEADPYVYACGVGGNAIFSYNDTPRHELVISGCHIARVIENGIEGNYREVSFNHIEQTGCRLSEGIWTPSTEGIYGSICVCKGNVVRDPAGEKAAIIIPRGFADGQPCFYEDNLLVCDAETVYPGSGFQIVVDRERFGYPLTLKNNTIRGFAKKYDLLNTQQAELAGLTITDAGEDDDVIKRADYYQNSLLGVHYAGTPARSIVRDSGFASLNTDGSLAEWTVLYGTAKLYATANAERYVRITGTSKVSCAGLAQDFRLGAEVYLARVRCRVRSSSGKVGFAPLSVNDAGTIVPGRGELVFNPQPAVLEVPSAAGSSAFHEVTHTMVVTQNCRICILNPGFDDTEGATVLSQLDVKDVELTLMRCQSGPESSGEDTEAGALYDFSTMTSAYAPVSALRVTYYLPGDTTAYKGTWCDATWMMGQYTGGTKGRGRIVLNGDAKQYDALTVWYESLFDLELGGYTLECANTSQYGFLQLFNGANVTVKGPGTLKAKNYALTLAAGCQCTLTDGVTVSGEGDYTVFLAAGSAAGRTSLTLENAAVGDILAEPFTALHFALPDADSTVSVTRVQTSGTLIIGQNTKLMNNGASTEVTNVQQATGLFYATNLAATYAAGHTDADITVTGDESSVTYSYLDADEHLVSAEGTLSKAFSTASETRTTRSGALEIRLNGDVYTYSGFWTQDLGAVRLNLNGYTLSTEHQSFALYLNANSDVTLYDRSDRGENTGLLSCTNYSTIIASGTSCKLNVNGGTVQQLTGNCIHAENGAAITLSGEAALTGKTGADLRQNATLTLEGGSITATDMCVQATPETDATTAITVHGGTLVSNNITIYAKDVTFAAVEGQTATLKGELNLTQAATIGANTKITVNGTEQATLKNATGTVQMTYETEATE